jgi:hypothetical protein
MEKRRFNQSFLQPIVYGNGRDSVKYQEKGRSIAVPAELTFGQYDRALYRHGVLKWDDTGEELTPSEREKVFYEICRYFDRKKIRWRFAD